MQRKIPCLYSYNPHGNGIEKSPVKSQEMENEREILTLLLMNQSKYKKCFDWFNCSSRYYDSKNDIYGIELDKTTVFYCQSDGICYSPKKDTKLLLCSEPKTRKFLIKKGEMSENFQLGDEETLPLTCPLVSDLKMCDSIARKISVNTKGIAILHDSDTNIPSPPFCNRTRFHVDKSAMVPYSRPAYSPILAYCVRNNPVIRMKIPYFPSCGDITSALKRTPEKANKISIILYNHLAL